MWPEHITWPDTHIDPNPTQFNTHDGKPREEGMDNRSYSLNSVNHLLMQITLTKFEKKSSSLDTGLYLST